MLVAGRKLNREKRKCSAHAVRLICPALTWSVKQRKDHKNRRNWTQSCFRSNSTNRYRIFLFLTFFKTIFKSNIVYFFSNLTLLATPIRMARRIQAATSGARQGDDVAVTRAAERWRGHWCAMENGAAILPPVTGLHCYRSHRERPGNGKP